MDKPTLIYLSAAGFVAWSYEWDSILRRIRLRKGAWGRYALVRLAEWGLWAGLSLALMRLKPIGPWP